MEAEVYNNNNKKNVTEKKKKKKKLKSVVRFHSANKIDYNRGGEIGEKKKPRESIEHLKT